VGIDPHSRKRLYVVMRDRGLLVSDDARHQKWEDLNLADADIAEILVHPRDKDLVYFASPTTGLYVSRDRAKTIEPVESDIEPIVPTLAGLAIHPVDQDHALGVTAAGIVFLSKDRGETWERAGRLGMTATLVHGESTASTWLAGGRFLLRSADDGATWERVYTPLDPEDRVVDLHRTVDGELWLLLERSRLIAKSADGGETWETLAPPTPSPGTWASSLALDASNAGHLLMATRTLQPLWTRTDEDGGVWESWDGGQTWARLSEGLVDPRAPLRDWNRGRIAAIDPATGLLLYGADGLGLFARVPVDPAGEAPDPAPQWIAVSPDLPKPRHAAFLIQLAEGAADGEITLQVEGAEDTRSLVRSSTSRLLARVQGEEDESPLWEALPDPGARLASLVADPHVPGQLLAVDAAGSAGVLVYGIPGVRPEPAPEEPTAPPEAAVPPEEERARPVGLLAHSAGSDAIVRAWGLVDQGEARRLEGHVGEVFAIALAPDGAVLATGGADRTLRLWDARDGTPKELLGAAAVAATINALAFSPDGTRVYGATEETWQVLEWDVAAGASRSLEGHTGGVLAIAVSDVGTGLVSGGRDRQIRCWDLETGSSTRTIDFGAEVMALAIAADDAAPGGLRIYAGGRDSSLRVYECVEGTELGRIELPLSYVSAIVVDATAGVVYVAGDGGVRALEVEGLSPVAAYRASKAPVVSLALSSDGRWLVGGDTAGGLWLWAIGTDESAWNVPTAHTGAVHAVCLGASEGEAAGAEAPVEESPPPEEEADSAGAGVAVPGD
jgi:WD40 repeat protein/photosystem II stability/assembly factor-like uncharacterized protein